MLTNEQEENILSLFSKKTKFAYTCRAYLEKMQEELQAVEHPLSLYDFIYNQCLQATRSKKSKFDRGNPLIEEEPIKLFYSSNFFYTNFLARMNGMTFHELTARAIHKWYNRLPEETRMLSNKEDRPEQGKARLLRKRLPNGRYTYADRSGFLWQYKNGYIQLPRIHLAKINFTPTLIDYEEFL